MHDVCCVISRKLILSVKTLLTAMSINTLCATFRKITVGRISTAAAAAAAAAKYSTQQSNCDANIVFHLTSNNYMQCGTESIHRIKFIPRTLNIDFGMPTRDLIRNIIEIPTTTLIPPLQEPINRLPIQYDSPMLEKSLDLPTNERIIEKQAVNMIRIRHKKMKKHKRKKFRKKMKFVLEKIRLKRRQKKEKLFEAELTAKVKEAEAFDAKEYVNEKLSILNKKILPRTFRGEILPAEMIKQFLDEKRARKEAKRNKPRLTL
ncbi:PREDICTED: uncharacterized protein LOC105152890 isoform X2 [Acromyrmex echinatior]|uniref:uncharacterized protein LOC105152890 isoform X2 n=1 Tax=Acromyrmex echinatior TaxID=103372 RepID=UPI00058100A1|nr:PREDICTED: uncharacterized protein LOC105152890 isoform X2 [Acromyrmex echinatior]